MVFSLIDYVKDSTLINTLMVFMFRVFISGCKINLVTLYLLTCLWIDIKIIDYDLNPVLLSFDSLLTSTGLLPLFYCC